MYRGKRIMKHELRKRPGALLASFLVLLSLTVAGTVAFLVDGPKEVENKFTPAFVPPGIEEEFNGETKSNVKIRNDGNIDAYIRAAIVINWVDADGNISGTVPVENTDYTITYDLGNGWKKGSDGYYYWTKRVEAEGTTGVLVESCTLKSSASVPDGYSLSLEVLAQTIQADGQDSQGQPPVLLAWGTEKGSVQSVGSDGTLTIKQ